MKPPSDTPTIGQQTMICCFETGLPRQTLQLKEESGRIEKEKKAQAGTVKPPSMTYFRRKPDPAKGEKGTSDIDGLQDLKDFQADFKKAVHALAPYPFQGGFYLAPAAVVNDLLKIQAEFNSKKAGLIENWIEEVYPIWKASAQYRMGTAYSEADFPTAMECYKKFRTTLTILPLAEKEQVARIALISSDAKAMLVQHADESQKVAIQQLHKQIWLDFMGPLQHMVKVFKKDKTKIHETVIGNLIQIAELIPSYKDLLNDPKLEEAAAEVKKVFSEIKVEDLRASAEHKASACTEAEKIINAFEPFARAFADNEE